MCGDEVTRWIEGLTEGEDAAVAQIWQRYYEPLVNLARRKLGQSSRRMADEEDVALSAFQSFCRGAVAGSFPQLDSRHDLWKLLVTITARKAAAQIRHAHRQKRGEGTVRGESVFVQPDASQVCGIDQAAGDDPTPAFIAEMSEQCEQLLERLNDPTLRQIALAKLEGYSNEDLAQQLQCAPRTIERKLAQIRTLWQEAK